MEATLVKVGRRYAVRLADGEYVSKNGVYTWQTDKMMQKYCLCFTKAGAKRVWNAYKDYKSTTTSTVSTVVCHLD